MKNKKTMRLLAATWLIAPTVLSTNAVFAVDNQTTDQTVSTGTSTSSSSTSETTDYSTEGTTGTTDSSTESSEPTDPADPSENEKPVETYTLTIAPSLIGKIQLTASSEDTAEQQPLNITESGTVEGLSAGTKVTYTITPAEGEQIASVAVNGAKEVNYEAKTFTVGTNNLSITAEFEPVPDTSTEEPTDPSEEVPSTPDPETPNKPDEGNNNNSNNNNGSNNSNNNNNNSNSGNSSNQTNPSGSNNNGNTQREPNHPNNGSSNGGTNNASSRPNTANQSGIEIHLLLLLILL